MAFGFPGGDIAADVLINVPIDFDDLTGVFAIGDEDRRRKKTAFRVFPPQEGLRPIIGIGLKGIFGLVIDDELLVFEGAFKLGIKFFLTLILFAQFLFVNQKVVGNAGGRVPPKGVTAVLKPFGNRFLAWRSCAGKKEGSVRDIVTFFEFVR